MFVEELSSKGVQENVSFAEKCIQQRQNTSTKKILSLADFVVSAPPHRSLSASSPCCGEG
jgi:hypothetical protein